MLYRMSNGSMMRSSEAYNVGDYKFKNFPPLNRPGIDAVVVEVDADYTEAEKQSHTEARKLTDAVYGSGRVRSCE